MEIYIKIDSMNESKKIYANSQTNVVEVNGKKSNVDAGYYVDKLDLITKNWKDFYVNQNIIDGSELKIKIVQDKTKERVIVCKNQFPENFFIFRWTIEEMENGIQG